MLQLWIEPVGIGSIVHIVCLWCWLCFGIYIEDVFWGGCILCFGALEFALVVCYCCEFYHDQALQTTPCQLYPLFDIVDMLFLYSKSFLALPLSFSFVGVGWISTTIDIVVAAAVDCHVLNHNIMVEKKMRESIRCWRVESGTVHTTMILHVTERLLLPYSSW